MALKRNAPPSLLRCHGHCPRSPNPNATASKSSVTSTAPVLSASRSSSYTDQTTPATFTSAQGSSSSVSISSPVTSTGTTTNGTTTSLSTSTNTLPTEFSSSNTPQASDPNYTPTSSNSQSLGTAITNSEDPPPAGSPSNINVTAAVVVIIVVVILVFLCASILYFSRRRQNLQSPERQGRYSTRGQMAKGRKNDENRSTIKTRRSWANFAITRPSLTLKPEVKPPLRPFAELSVGPHAVGDQHTDRAHDGASVASLRLSEGLCRSTFQTPSHNEVSVPSMESYLLSPRDVADQGPDTDLEVPSSNRSSLSNTSFYAIPYTPYPPPSGYNLSVGRNPFDN